MGEIVAKRRRWSWLARLAGTKGESRFEKPLWLRAQQGNIGSAVAEKLKAQGHEVRSVSRRTGINLDDASALKRAFSGADSAFLLIPPEISVADLQRRQNEVGQKLAQTAKEAGIRRVVFLSSVSAQLDSGTGPILGLHDMEERLNAMSFAELVHLRPCFFMENQLWGLPLVAQKAFTEGYSDRICLFP